MEYDTGANGAVRFESSPRYQSNANGLARHPDKRRGMEQWLARRAHNPKVAGSNPVPATFLFFPGGVAQSVEQGTHKCAAEALSSFAGEPAALEESA